ncbi:MAG: cytochrome P460 family protein [Psychroserpens sp.]|uniref:cytochrome P460 family protein n=1 Tax=Psychroserpens sp. TaxID=2020870 RepID=UPI0030036487
MKVNFFLIVILVLILSACTKNKEKVIPSEVTKETKMTNEVYSYFESGSNDGVMSVPENYREWDFLGAWAIDGDKGSKGIHNVYASPGAVSFYQKNKYFPDGCILVKELMNTHTEYLSTGLVSRANENEGWFVMVKDAKNRFPDNPLWGDGWGWSFFEAGKMYKTVSTDYKANCIACHVPAEKDDWIYVDGYPVLKLE